MTQTARRQHADAPQCPLDRLKAFIETRRRHREEPARIANAVCAYFDVALDADQVVPYWKGEITLPTQTEHRPDKESVQFAADEPKEPLFTRMADAETPDPVFTFSIAPESSIATDPAPAPGGTGADDASATQTGRRQDQKTRSVLTDEVKAFIVRGLARYEDPDARGGVGARRSSALRSTAGRSTLMTPPVSRPPAQRWIDLHAAMRAKVLDAIAEIGIAQKVVRLRMLDRFANRADENNQMERAAAFLVQAAKECGGFYGRTARPKREAAPASA